MMAAAKKGSFVKKRRSDPTRNRRPEPDPDPSPYSPETRRSLRPRQRRYLADFADEFDLEDEEDEEESKGGKKLLKLPPISTGRCRDSSPVTAPKSRRVVPDRHVSPQSDYSPSTSQSATSESATSASQDVEDEEEDETVQPLKKRRIERVGDLDGHGHGEERRGNVIRRPIRAVSGTPMPERSVLEAILNMLQKKDTYGVFTQPVDPDELPDYHDVIAHPMDFGTVRKKLASSQYVSFEQFEDDVFLICSNAMQYNAPDTIYFRQARSIQDMARRNFQEIRANLTFSGAGRKSEENIRSASFEKNKIKKIHSGIASRPSSFCVSSEKTTPRQPCKDAHEPLCCDIPPMEKKTTKKHYRTPPEPYASDISSMEKKTLWKPPYRTPPEPPRSDISFMEKKTLKKSHYRTAHESHGSDVSSMEKKTLKKPQHKNAPEARVSYVSSIKKKKAINPQYSPVHESPYSDYSSMEEKPENKPLFKTEPDAEPAGSDISSRAKTTSLNEFQSRTEIEPLCSDISSRDKKTQEEHKSRIAPEPLDSDISSGATLASSAGTLTDLSKIPVSGNALATDPCTGFSTVEVSDTALVGDISIGSPMMKDGGVDRSVSINGSADGSSPSENILEKPDDVQAKSSPSKLELKPCMNRRVTYTLDDQPVVETDSVFDVFEGETKQLVSVALDSEYSYARSLARFASFLGPVAWEIASKKIEQAVPPGVKFGPGWVGEYEPVLTPVLSPGTSMRLLPVKRRGMINEIKLEAVSAVSRKNMNDKTSQVSNGQCKDVSFGPESPMTIGMPSNKSSNPLEGRERSRAQKKGIFGVNPELQPCTSRTAPPQQKNELAGCRLDICPEAPKSVHPSLSSKGLTQVLGETQKQQQPRTRVAQMRGETQKQQQQKNQVSGDLVKAYTNETTRNRPDIYAEARASTSPEVSYLGNSQLQPEPLKQPDAVASQRRNDSLGMNVGTLNGWKSRDIGQITPFSIITNQQPGVQYWLARGSQEHAVNDPSRWMNSTGNLSTQPNIANRCSNNLQQSMPTVQVPKREYPNAAAGAAAQAWMSIGASAEWKPVNGGCLPNKQVGSPSFNPAWKPPGHASRVYEEANIKPEPLPGVPENTQTQTKGLVFYPQLMSNDLSRLRSPWQGLAPRNNQKDTLPPDLNIRFQPPVSPARSSSGILRDSQQPDLALQL